MSLTLDLDEAKKYKEILKFHYLAQIPTSMVLVSLKILQLLIKIRL